MKTIRGRNCGVVLLDNGASNAKQDKYPGENANTPLVELPKELLHEATGKSDIPMAIRKGGLAKAIFKR